MPREKKTSPWVWVAVGCGGAILLIIIVFVILGAMAFRWAKNVEATMNDPEARQEKVMNVLGAGSLPDGYHAMAGVTIPFLMEVAVLTDNPPPGQGEHERFGDHGFIFVKMRTFGKQQDELRDFFEGKTDSASILDQSNIDIDTQEMLTHGSIEGGRTPLLYNVQRGGVRMGHNKHAGLTSMILADCGAEDKRVRLGIWFGPDPTGGGEATPQALAGSIGDEDRIRSFMSHFDVCVE